MLFLLVYSLETADKSFSEETIETAILIKYTFSSKLKFLKFTI